MSKYILIHPYRHHSYEIVKALKYNDRNIEAVYGFYDKYNLGKTFNLKKIKGYYNKEINSCVKTFFSCNILFILAKLKVIKSSTYIKYFQKKAIKRINKEDIVILLQDYCEDILNYCIKNNIKYIYDHIMPCGYKQRELLLKAAKKNKFSFEYVDNYMPIRKIKKNLYYISKANLVLNASKSTFLIAESALVECKKTNNKLLPYGSNFGVLNECSDSYFKPVPKKRYRQSIKILYVGSLSLVKGTDMFIEIVDACETLDIEFGVVGVANQLEDYKFIEEIKKRKNVKYYGHIAYSLIKTIYSKYDILIMTSRVEGFGMVILEAMSAANICIVNEECKNVINNRVNGFVCSNSDINEYVSVINDLLNDKYDNRNLSFKSYNTSKEYTWERYYIELNKYIEEDLK